MTRKRPTRAPRPKARRKREKRDLLDLFLARIREIIESDGQYVQSVFADRDDRPSFAYTVGNAGRALPEFIVLGDDAGAFGQALDDLGRQQRDGTRRFKAGDVVTLDGYNVPLRLGATCDFARSYYATLVSRYYRLSDFELLQVIWPDRQGRFPGEPGWRRARHVQPLLDDKLEMAKDIVRWSKQSVRERDPTPIDPKYAWDRARALPALRRADPRRPQAPEPLEAGVNYFVLQIERLGGKTFASCEGHPDGFYVALYGPDAVWKAIVAANKASGEPFELSLGGGAGIDTGEPEEEAETLILRLPEGADWRKRARLLRRAAQGWDEVMGALRT